MKRKLSILLLIGVFSLMLLLFPGCKKKETAQPAPGNVFITRLSNPDESLNSILKGTDRSLWGKYLDKDSAIKTDDRLSICFHIGVKGANALLAVFLDDYDTAEKIGRAMKDASDKLNIKSDAVETVAKKLSEDLEIQDAGEKEQTVKRTLNMLQDQVVKALNNIGNQSEALMIEFGAWIEALRQTSGIVKDDYSEMAATVFRREVEAKHFKTQFQTLNAGKPEPRYKDSIAVSSRLLELMRPKAISKEAVNEIHQLSTMAYEKGIK